ncbi:MAG: SiaB family protein kinase [Flavobacteriales bacterium]
MTYSSPLLSAYEFFEKSINCGISFAYRGPFMDDLTTRIIDISENTITDNNQLPKISRKISFLLVECFQNIVRHGEETPEELAATLNDGLFSFKNIGGVFVINSINLVETNQIETLKVQVEYINSLNSVELKEVYRTALRDNEMSGKGGAGLGLIELARKSGQKIKYKVESVSETMSLFHQQVMFTGTAEEVNIDHIDFTGDTLSSMHSSNLLLQYKGDFSQRSILPLLRIVEDNMGSNEAEIKRMKKVGHLLIEILQNISKHGESNHGKKEGVFLIGTQNNSFFIEAGNPVDLDQKEQFENLLACTISSSVEELETQIKDRLTKSLDGSQVYDSGLGLLEIAKSSAKPLHYHFTETPDGRLFFSLKAFV